MQAKSDKQDVKKDKELKIIIPEGKKRFLEKQKRQQEYLRSLYKK